MINTLSKIKLRDLVTLPLILLVLSFAFFLLNSTYVSYPDEFVNLLGGKIILMGKLPYRDFFDHHMPLAWYLAAAIQLVSRTNYVTFRIIWALFQGSVVVGLGSWIYVKHRRYAIVYGFWSVLYATAAMYFWLHLYLGDSLAVIFFSVALWIILLEMDHPSRSRAPLVWASLSIAALLFSSLTYLYLGMFMYLWILVLQMSNSKYQIANKNQNNNRNVKMNDKISKWSLLKYPLSNIFRLSSIIFPWASLFAAPYAVYGLYLVVTGSLKDFWFANFVYNTTLYISIPNYTAHAARFNPLRFAFTVADNFWGSYLGLLSLLAHPSFYFPMDRTVGLATLMLLIYLLWKRIPYGFIFLGMLTFSAPRSGQLTDMKQTDYQMGVFIILGTIAAAYLIHKISHDLDLHGYFMKFVRSVCLLMLILYFTSTLVFAMYNSLHVKYERYMEKLPPISNLSDLADFTMNIVPPGESYWIGPYEGNTTYFVQGRTSVLKYPSLLPQFAESDYLRGDFIAQMEQSRPTVIIFKHDASIFMTPSIRFGSFFLDWMKGRYSNCVEAHVACMGQVGDLKMREDIYVRNDRLDLLKKI